MAGASKSGSAALPSSELYEHDYYAWILDQVHALRERRIEEIDWENVAEEIEDLGKSEKRALRSQIARLYEHLLKLAYASERMLSDNKRNWELTVISARNDINDLLEESPSLRGKIAELLNRAYQSGRIQALIATRLSEKTIPDTCPWSFEQAMDDNFFPGPRTSE